MRKAGTSEESEVSYKSSCWRWVPAPRLSEVVPRRSMSRCRAAPVSRCPSRNRYYRKPKLMRRSKIWRVRTSEAVGVTPALTDARYQGNRHAGSTSTIFRAGLAKGHARHSCGYEESSDDD